MAKQAKKTEQEVVTVYYQELVHPLREVIVALEAIITGTDSNIAQQIKWNSPSFYYTGDMKPFDPKEYKRDIVVMNLHKQDRVLLIFPTGAKVQDTTGLLEGKFTDGRKMITISSVGEAQGKAEGIQSVIRDWISLVE